MTYRKLALGYKLLVGITLVQFTDYAVHGFAVRNKSFEVHKHCHIIGRSQHETPRFTSVSELFSMSSSAMS
jgi:hypothetical protein